jgi:hypothetical protein
MLKQCGWKALSTVTPEIWAKCVDHAEKEIVDWWEKEQVIEQQEVQPLIKKTSNLISFCTISILFLQLQIRQTNLSTCCVAFHWYHNYGGTGNFK